MFKQLLESRRRPQSRAGSGMVSAAMHIALVGGLVVITARSQMVEREKPVEQQLIYTQRPEPPAPPVPTPPSAGAPPTASTREAVPPTPIIPALIDVPDVIPDIDLTRAVASDADWQRRGTVVSSGGSTGGGTVGGTGSGTRLGSGDVFREMQVDRPVVMMPGGPSPRFPETLRSAGIAGEVTAEFVVDTAGRVESSSLRILSADHALFERAVRDVLPRLSFLPAEYHGRRVRQLVQLPFRFALN